MAKKSVIEKTKQLFLQYLEDNGYSVESDGYGHRTYSLQKPSSPTKQRNTYFADDYLNANLDNIGQNQRFFIFLHRVLNMGEHEVALYQAIKKTPGPKNPQYDKSVNSIINTIKPFKKTLFDYVARTSFLEHSWRILPEVFKEIDGQIERSTIFELVFNTKTFKSTDTQKEVYGLVNQYIKQPAKYQSYFNRIQKIEENQSLVENIKHYSVVSMEYDLDKLVGANLNRKGIESSEINNSIEKTCLLIQELKDPEMGIQKVLFEPIKNHRRSFNIICEDNKVNINTEIFENIVNKIARMNSYEEVRDFREEDNLQIFLREEKARFLRDKLNQALNTNDAKQKPKGKI